MPSVCLCFAVHQPYRLRNYTFFDINRTHDYFDDELNRSILGKIVERCYLPANDILLKLIDKHKGEFRIAISMTGVVLEQLEKNHEEALESFKRLAETGQVEFVNQVYYHSLAALFSMKEFEEQVRMNRDKIKALFGQVPKTFLNTEMLYRNDLAREIERLGYKAILTEGADQLLGWRSPNFVYQPAGCLSLKCLLRNYRLSDDIAFRFSDSSWSAYPLQAEKYADWIHRINTEAEVINLFLNYETFGEHHRKSSGIFEFLEELPSRILERTDFEFLKPLEVARKYQPVAQLDVSQAVSCADVDKDLTAWVGNHMQRDAIQNVYGLERDLRRMKNRGLMETWRKLQSSDLFYYMSTKCFADGEVHRYFNPHASPYEAYINFMNIITDFSNIVEEKAQALRKGKGESS